METCNSLVRLELVISNDNRLLVVQVVAETWQALRYKGVEKSKVAQEETSEAGRA